MFIDLNGVFNNAYMAGLHTTPTHPWNWKNIVKRLHTVACVTIAFYLFLLEFSQNIFIVFSDKKY